MLEFIFEFPAGAMIIEGVKAVSLITHEGFSRGTVIFPAK
jgi:hypothetical protein